MLMHSEPFLHENALDLCHCVAACRVEFNEQRIGQGCTCIVIREEPSVHYTGSLDITKC